LAVNRNAKKPGRAPGLFTNHISGFSPRDAETVSVAPEAVEADVSAVPSAAEPSLRAASETEWVALEAAAAGSAVASAAEPSLRAASETESVVSEAVAAGVSAEP